MAPITLRYAEGKNGLSRKIKVKLSKVQDIFRSKAVLSFDEVTESEWKTMIDEASIDCGLMSVESLWRNPDVQEQSRSFAPREPKQNWIMPKVIRDIHLSPISRDGSRYCPLPRQGNCEMDIEGREQGKTRMCKLGHHRCAALLKTGSTCHMKHPAKDCRMKRHYDPNTVTVNQEEAKYARESCRLQREAKRARTEVSGEASASTSVPAKKRRIDPRQVEEVHFESDQHAKAVINSSIMDALMPELVAKRQDHMGIRINPEMRTMVAKVCKDAGELWLGALPTKDRLDGITSGGLTPMHIQICCFKKHPTEVLVDDDEGGRGVIIPNAEFFKLEMSNPKMRQHDFRKLRTTVIIPFRQGNNAYVHCVTGLSRAPVAACILVSSLMKKMLLHLQGISQG